MFDKSTNKYTKSTVATNFKNANKGKFILSHRIRVRLSVYNKDLKQISKYLFAKDDIQKVKTTIEDFKTEKEYVNITTIIGNKKNTKNVFKEGILNE